MTQDAIAEDATTELTPEQQAELDAANDAAADEASSSESNEVTVIPTDDPEARKAVEAVVAAKVKDAKAKLDALGSTVRPIVEALGKTLADQVESFNTIARAKLDARFTIPKTVMSVAPSFEGQLVVVHDWNGQTDYYSNWSRTYVDNILDKAAPLGPDGLPNMDTTDWIEKAKKKINNAVTDQMRAYLEEHDLLAEAEHIGLDLRTNKERAAERRNRQSGGNGGGSTQRGVGSLAETAANLAKESAPERVAGTGVELFQIILTTLKSKDASIHEKVFGQKGEGKTGVQMMTPQARRELFQHLNTARGVIENVFNFLDASGVRIDGNLNVPKVEEQETSPPAEQPEAVTA